MSGLIAVGLLIGSLKIGIAVQDKIQSRGYIPDSRVPSKGVQVDFSTEELKGMSAGEYLEAEGKTPSARQLLKAADSR